MALIILLPRLLTDPKYVTLATWGLVAATLVLGTVTLLLVLDSRANRRVQQERWRREDAAREADNALKAEFGLRKSDVDHQLILWCANMGAVDFLLTEIKIDGILETAGSTKVELLKTKPVLVSRGRIEEVNLSKVSRAVRGSLRQHWRVTLCLSRPSGEVTTTGKPYYILITNSQVVRVDSGFSGCTPLMCPQCNETPFMFRYDGLVSEDQLTREMAEARAELQQSCPEHRSSLARVSELPPIPEAAGWLTPE